MLILGGWVFLMSEVPLHTLYRHEGRVKWWRKWGAGAGGSGGSRMLVWERGGWLYRITSLIKNYPPPRTTVGP